MSIDTLSRGQGRGSSSSNHMIYKPRDFSYLGRDCHEPFCFRWIAGPLGPSNEVFTTVNTSQGLAREL
jgi:hypothetical protein